MVKKPSGKWRMCVDFMDLNKACPKDSFPLPHINLLIDSTVQIQLHDLDQEKTSFMPFWLKNARARYQRLVNTMFRKQLGRNVEVYFHDVLVKCVKSEEHMAEL